MVRKPIALAVHLLKTIPLAIGAAVKPSSEICNITTLKRNGYKIMINTLETIVAWGSAFLCASGIGAPATTALAAIGLGSVGSVVAVSHTTAIAVNTFTQTPAINLALNVESGAKGVYLGAEYFLTNPNNHTEENIKAKHTALKVAHKGFQEATEVANKRIAYQNMMSKKHELIEAQLDKSSAGKAILKVNNIASRVMNYIPEKIGIISPPSTSSSNKNSHNGAGK